RYMSPEIEKILRMVEEGKINSSEGTELIRLLNDEKQVNEVKQKAYSINSVRIKVLSNEIAKVNVTTPLKLVQVLINIGKGIASTIPESEKYLKDVDLDIVTEAIEQQVEGHIVDLETEEGERVIISIE